MQPNIFPAYIYHNNSNLITQLQMGIYWYISALVGSVVLIRALLAFLNFLRIALRPLDAKWAQKYGIGSYALVTGCTEGIGKAFCFQLAALGFNLMLISRNKSKLQTLSQNLKAVNPNLKTVICQADFAQNQKSLWDGIGEKLANIDVSILVNNVGYLNAKKYDSFNSKQIEAQINTNINAMTYLTHQVLPSFLNRKSNKCAIINLSSQLIYYHIRSASVYIATKAYNDSFSRCLSTDYNDVIDILSLRPGLVSTPASNNFKGAVACSAEQCVKWALKALGLSQTTEGHWIHTFLSWLDNITGVDFTKHIIQHTFDEIQQTRHK